MEKINRIIIERGTERVEIPVGGSATIVEGEPIPKDTVNSQAIVDESVEEHDLSKSVQAGLHELEDESNFATPDMIAAMFAKKE